MRDRDEVRLLISFDGLDRCLVFFFFLQPVDIDPFGRFICASFDSDTKGIRNGSSHHSSKMPCTLQRRDFANGHQNDIDTP